MDTADGLERFQNLLPQAVRDDVLAWDLDPELGKILGALWASPDDGSFFDTLAEVHIARHLAQHGCAARVEVPTPSGKTCDFQVIDTGAPLFLHVKHLDTDRPVRRHLTVSSRLRYLERIRRPYIVRIRWQPGLDDRSLQRFVTEAAQFIRRARIGDEHTVVDDAGQELGGCLIAAPWEGTHVTLAIGLPDGFVDHGPRMQKLLRKAYRQFMPRATNVILLGTSQVEDAVDFETALLGTHVERWDAHPPRGRRVAHGRDDDGFWHGARFRESAAVVWFCSVAETDAIRGRLWVREDAGLDPAIETWLDRVFGQIDAD